MTGFTLVELLLVITIMALIAGFLVPAVGRFLAAQRLSSAMLNLSAQLALARQTAISSHTPVEIHFYQLTNSIGQAGYTALRLFTRTNATNTAVPYTSVTRLPAGIALVTQSNYSTLVTDVVQTNTESVPGQTDTANYRVLCFLPNGQADLSLTNTNTGAPEVWTVTLADIRFSTNGTPPNYGTLVVDPLTGKTFAYRP